MSVRVNLRRMNKFVSRTNLKNIVNSAVFVFQKYAKTKINPSKKDGFDI
jgi:hypothetical protein